MEKVAIVNQLKREYVLKSKSAVLGILSVAILFPFNGLTGTGRLITWGFIFVHVLINLLRYNFYYLYRNNKIKIEVAIKNMTMFTILNSTVWFLYSIFLMYEHNFALNVYNVICISVLISFSSSLITMLYWNRKLLYYCLITYSAPIFIFCTFNIYNRSDYIFLIWNVLTIVNSFFIIRQSKLNFYEATQRITTSEKLKILIEENQEVHKNLQKETFNKLQASKLSSLVELASGISHEINNPLTIIRINNNKLLENDFGLLNEKQQEKLEKNRIAIERIEKVIGSFSTVTGNITNEEFKENSLLEILNSVLELFYEKSKIANIKIENKLSDLKVVCIAPQISQIFINILNNAYEALSEIEGNKKITIESRENKEGIEIIIRNNGPKISVENIENIFLPFYTTKEFGAGPGLGLTLSRSLANGNGGTLEYLAHEHETAFVIKLRKSI